MLILAGSMGLSPLWEPPGSYRPASAGVFVFRTLMAFTAAVAPHQPIAGHVQLRIPTTAVGEIFFGMHYTTTQGMINKNEWNDNR